MENSVYNLKAGNTTILVKLFEKIKQNKKAATIGSSPLALILSACGSSSSDTASNLLTLTKSGETYSATNVTGFSVTDSSTAKFDIADATSNSYEIKLDATGSGVLEFDFADASDVVTFTAGSKVSGFTTLKVTDGTIDATNADLSGITRIEVASGITISLAQIKDIPTIVANSATSVISVEVATEAEAAELVSLVSAGTVKVFGDVNPIKLVAAAEATVTAETLSTKQTETTSSVQPASEAPEDTSTDTSDASTGTDSGTSGGGTVEEPIRFTMPGDASGNYTPGLNNGDITVTKSDSDYVVTPATGTPVQLPSADVTSFIVNSITMNGDAVVLDGETITGTGNIAITKLEGDAAADLSNITVSGTKTVAVSGDVTFTGNLGSGFTTTVASGATLTGDIAKLHGNSIDGAGTVAITDLQTDNDADLTTITATSVTATFNDNDTFTGDLGTAEVTVATGKVLTAAASVLNGETITGGSVVMTGDVTNDTDLTNITSSFDANDADVAISSSKTLTMTAAQAAGETFSGAGTLSITASDDAQSITATTATLSIATGDGNDSLDAGAAANITNDDVINLGDGTDSITISADNDSTGAVFDNEGHVGVEQITVAAGSTADNDARVELKYAAAYDQDITIDASGMNDSSANFTLVSTNDANVDGDILVKGSSGINTIDTGDGADIFEMGVMASFVATDVITAGDGTDILKLTADDDSTGAVFDNDNTGIEKIVILSGANDDDTAKLELNYAQAVTTALEIDASALTNDDAIFTLAIDSTNAANVDNALTVTGGSANDSITTGDGNDSIIGGAGNDSIDGDGGTDSVSYADITAAATAQHGIADAKLLGVAVNLSGSAVTESTINTAFSGITVNTFGDADVAAGKQMYLLTENDATGGDKLDTISNVEAVAGSARADYIALGSGGMSATAGAGDDVIVGGAGNDSINGGDGNDSITGGNGLDSLTGGGGIDTFILEAQASDAGVDTTVDFVTTVDKINVNGSLSDGNVSGSAFASFDGDGTAADNVIVNYTAAAAIDSTAAAALFEASASSSSKMVLADGDQAILVVQDDNDDSSSDFNAQIFVVTSSTGLSATQIATIGIEASESSHLVFADFV